MKNKKNIDTTEEAEYGLDSRYQSKKDRNSDSAMLMEARLSRMKNLSKDQILRARLLQLKLKMEDYLKQPVYDNRSYFSEFLQSYIDILYPTRSKFARDINVKPIRLSQVINNHRDPQEEFIMKLMIHSEKVFANVCEFQNRTWFQVYFHEKICDTMANQKKWRPGIEKEIKISESIC